MLDMDHRVNCGRILQSLFYCVGLLLTVLLGVQTSNHGDGNWPPVHYDVTAAKVLKW